MELHRSLGMEPAKRGWLGPAPDFLRKPDGPGAGPLTLNGTTLSARKRYRCMSREFPRRQCVQTRSLRKYLRPRVIDMDRFVTALMQALHDAYAQGWKDRDQTKLRGIGVATTGSAQAPTSRKETHSPAAV